MVLFNSALAKDPNLETAIFAGGCFWCIESELQNLKGVREVISGYTGGTVENPSYAEVVSKKTGHKEAVQVIYDPERIDYKTLLNAYWQNIDPYDAEGQFYDRGSSYQTAIFVNNPVQKQLAQDSKEEIEAYLGKRVSVPILEAMPFYRAEEEHQDYARKNPAHYERFKRGSGRELKLDAIWQDFDKQISGQ